MDSEREHEEAGSDLCGGVQPFVAGLGEPEHGAGATPDCGHRGGYRGGVGGDDAGRGRRAFPPARPNERMTDYTTVSIPTELAERVDETIEGTSFSSTSDLVRFLLRSIVIKHQQRGELTEAEFEEIAEQLEDLGYLE